MDDLLIRQLSKRFYERFGEEPLVVRSPGRINIIGEHTDYNGGFVLPGAIDKAIYIAITLREDDQIQLYSEDFQEAHVTDLHNIKPSEKGWPNYILGVVDQLIKRNYSLKGFNINLDGDVPIGAGLSSSAAVECAVIFALNHLFELNLSKMDMALLAQKAEHEFAHVMCGIMDQFASIFGRHNHVMKLDCRNLEYEYVPLELGDHHLVLFNTNVKHSLASSAYNKRREECEEAVKLVKKHIPEVETLRDVSMEQLEKYVAPVNEIVFRRSKYVVNEIKRLLSACKDLKNRNLEALGKKMYETHVGLSKDYEVSCSELDFLVDTVRKEKSVLGARMMGGGFGGCTINIIQTSEIERIKENVQQAYKQETGLDMTSYTVSVEEGSCIVMNHK